MDKKHIYLASPTMNGREMKFIEEAFASNWIAPLGPNVNEFERELAAYVGTSHAAALSSGTAAIHLALKAAGINQGDIVFCSSLTFSATCNPILYQGAIPVFIDSERDTWNMDPNALSKAFAKYPNAKAVVIVNLYGTPAKLDEILSICNEYNVPLIEDAAESLGATYRGKQTGTFGRFGIYSFNGNKIITTSGGGMLVSEDGEDIEKARFWSTQSREKERHYEHKEIGYNYRMSNIIAGIGRGQLLSLDKHIELKKKIYETYKKSLEDICDITLNPIPENCEPNYWLTCITINRDSKIKHLDIMLALENECIESRPIWKPMHLQPIFHDCGFVKADDTIKGVSEDIFNQGVCLPSDIKNTDEDMNRIVGIIRKLFER
ncbi:MAG: beta-eliminating lyase family protein [Herbinix sp.]|jgi:dTDP-4-amino-4,6-dideoxygalactose transaminase|nr:beta-eliminating lyase family protein [Herbinix sp.]